MRKSPKLNPYSYTDEGVAVLNPAALRSDPEFRAYIRRLRKRKIGNRRNGVTYEDLVQRCATMTVRQIEKEIASMRAYMNKHGKAYAWHGSGMTPPGHLSDGDKMSALKEALKIAKKSALLRCLRGLQRDMEKAAFMLSEYGADRHASELSGASEMLGTWIVGIEEEAPSE